MSYSESPPTNVKSMLPPSNGNCVPRDALQALASYGVRPGLNSYVLVLGSGGLVGRALVAMLKAQSYNVLEVKGRNHRDLREPGALDFFSHLNVRFAFFLAAEVGGSKYLTKGGEADKAIWDFNVAMYDSVFPWLEKKNVPFVFASSQLSNQPTPYGRVKKMGEERIAELNAKRDKPLGKIVKFWNVVGPEFIGSRSHVIPDLAQQCVRFGTAQVLTDGQETREYVHTDDITRGLIGMMEQFDTIPSETHLTNSVASSLRDVARELDRSTPGGCNVKFGSTPSTKAHSDTPDHVNHYPPHGWRPFRSLNDTVARVVDYYMDMSSRNTLFYGPGCTPYLSVVLTGRNDAYSAGYVQRVQNYASLLAKFADRYQLCTELIVVEFGVEAGKQLVFDLVQWPKEGLYGGVRSIIVPTEVAEKPFRDGSVEHFVPQHRWEAFKQAGPFMYEYIAKNVGIRRARAEFVLSANADSLIGEEVVEFLAKRQLEKDFVYRVERVDLPENAPTNDLEQLLIWGAQHGTREPNHHKKNSPRLRYPDPKYFSNPSDHLYTYHSGDFLLFHRSVFDRAGGFPEAPYNTHVDSLFMMSLWGIPHPPWQAVIDGAMFHQHHDNRVTYTRPMLDWPEVAGWVNVIFCQGPTDYSRLDWGLAPYQFEEKSTL